MIRPKVNRRKADTRRAKLRLPALRVPWRSLAAGMLGTGVLIGAGLLGKELLDQPVQKLIVQGGLQRVTAVQIEAAVAPELDDGFLSADLGKMRERVRALDWVDQVRVGRVWPDTVTVQITEHRAAARWRESGLLNTRGELFTEHAQYDFPELPSLVGPPGTEHEVAKRYLDVRGPLVAAELALESIEMDERGAWRVLLAGGQEIRLGRQDVDARLATFFRVVAPALGTQLSRVQYVDLRYTNGFAVGWLPEATSLAKAATAKDDSRG
jgi:cell division protein FtsQ